ncbi:hypothetical protein RHGRI_030633 [Rhododendron griersonianum]|uniref:CCHC-type domain-containing protein n=2 Tax=Rhododendron griersonianum TaxID=479676 RepID=A0AAV6I866_9ERIC|nr:hypothetical protein RHGRI_030633 [Rhododendron griersonianum]
MCLQSMFVMKKMIYILPSLLKYCFRIRTSHKPRVGKRCEGKRSYYTLRKIESGIELALNKKKRKCHLCNKLGHDKRTCSSNPMSKTHKGK